ncbi:ATP-binding protein [Streptomyces sp. NPDC058320]|uniref:ATP-binding protein n=1 Tax=unclassified Streptomyces TaxID=2593676 RepID=UPI00363AC698
MTTLRETAEEPAGDEAPEDAAMQGPDSYGAWRRENAAWLSLRLELLRLRLNRRALWLQRPLPEGAHTADWLLAGGDGECERDFYAGDATAQAIDELAAAVEARLAASEQRLGESGRPPALRALVACAGLSPFEEELVLLAAAPAYDGTFGRAYAELHGDARHTHATLHLALGLFLDDPAERLLAADCLTPGQPLRALRLLAFDEEPNDGAQPLLTRPLGADERISDYLRGVNRPDSRLAPLLTPIPAALPVAATRRTAEQLVALVSAEAGHWPAISLTGPADSGAREAAEYACAALGRPLFALDPSELAACPQERHDLVLALLGREALLTGCALYVDAGEVEQRSAAEAALNRLIASVAAPVFVAGPEPWPGVPAGVRPDIVPVPPPTRAEQIELWQTALGSCASQLENEVEALVQQYAFGPDRISAAVARAGRSAENPALGITGRDLRRSCREVGPAGLAALAQLVVPCHSWGDIVAPKEVIRQLRELADQVANRSQVYEQWGFGARLGRGRGITALFAGPSGTGKTMAAEILAGHLELDLYRVDLAAVVSKYIGETEKNLRRVFDAAEGSGTLLFFDEADALFGNRTEVRDSHDRYANVEIDYLLQRMEDYTGLAVLATNRRGALDSAFLRRLRFVIDFPFPEAADRRRLWERAFPPQVQLDELKYSHLSRLELSGGNIRTIAINAAFLAATEGAPVGMVHLVRAAAREYTKLSKPIGVAEFGEYHTVARS